MKTNINFQDNYRLLSEMKSERCSFEVLEFESLHGGKDVNSAITMYFMKEANIKLRTVKIILDKGSVKLESGALYYLKGDIGISNKIGGVKGFGKKLLTSRVTGESTFKPSYEGTGEIILEPSFGHYALIELEDEEIIVDDGLFYACEDGVEIGAAMQKNFSSSLLGGEGLFQTKLHGRGIVVLELPVPEMEIVKYRLNNDTLKVDGNFALLRSSGVNFTVEKASKSIIASGTSGEGFLNVFSGTGEVWIAPTQYVYDKLGYFKLSGMTNPGGSSNTSTK